MKVTVALDRSKRTGVELVNISVVYENANDLLTVWGEIIADSSSSDSNNDLEPEVLVSFHDEGGKILFARKAVSLMPFIVNKYSFFQMELSAATNYLDLSNVKEIRLHPFFKRVDS